MTSRTWQPAQVSVDRWRAPIDDPITVQLEDAVALASALAEPRARLDRRDRLGPTPEAFTSRHPFPPSSADA